MFTTAVFLSHGIDDARADVKLGLQAHRTLKQIGLQGRWKEYTGEENEGLSDIVEFLRDNDITTDR